MRLAGRPYRLATLAAVAATALALVVGSAAAADPPSADEVVRQMKSALEPPKASVRTMTMTFDDHGQKTSFGLVQARKKIADGEHSLTVLLEPADARGIAYLTADAGTGDPVEWLYVPYVQRTRKLVPAENYQSFMDTDFTYGDLGLLPVDTKNTMLGTEQVDGKKTYKVESIPGSTVKQWYYSRIGHLGRRGDPAPRPARVLLARGRPLQDRDVRLGVAHRRHPDAARGHDQQRPDRQQHDADRHLGELRRQRARFAVRARGPARHRRRRLLEVEARASSPP